MWRGQQGSAALLAILGMLFLGGFGATAVSLVSTGEETRALTYQAVHAYALAQAGIEYGKYRIDNGLDPNVTNFPLGTGTFTVAGNPQTGQLTAVGRVGNAQRTFAITTPYAKDCFDIDVSQAHSSSSNLVDMKLYKNCLKQVTVTKWIFTWTPNNGERTLELQVQGDDLFVLYDDFLGYASGELVDAVDYTLDKAPGVPTQINKLEFNQTLTPGKVYSITAVLSDGSSASDSFTDE